MLDKGTAKRHSLLRKGADTPTLILRPANVGGPALFLAGRDRTEWSFENQPSRDNSMAETHGLGKPDTLRHMKMMSEPARTRPETDTAAPKPARQVPSVRSPDEIGGPKGPEPTRYGDWEVGGRCTDF